MTRAKQKFVVVAERTLAVLLPRQNYPYVMSTLEITPKESSNSLTFNSFVKFIMAEDLPSF